MSVKSCFIAGFLLAALSAVAFSEDLASPKYQPIRQFYADCSFVAQNSTQPEIASVIRMLQNKMTPPDTLTNGTKKKIYKAIQSTQKMILQPDPCIFGLPVTLPYSFITTPLGIISANGATVTVKVSRESVLRKGNPNKPAAPSDSNGDKGSAHGSTVVTEIDTWVKVDGKWMLQALHYYRV